MSDEATSHDDATIQAALEGLASARGFNLADGSPSHGPSTDPPEVVEGQRSTESDTPDAASQPADNAPAAEKPPEKTEDKPQGERALYDRIARMDAAIQKERAERRRLEQEARELRSRLEEDDQAWKRNPLEAVHRRGLSLEQLNRRHLELGEEPPKDDAKNANLPPEVQAALAELDSLKQWREQSQRQLQEYQAQQETQRQVEILRNHLQGFGDEYALINDLGEHESVLRKITDHLAGGRFDDEEHAATVIAAIAKQEETRLQAQLRQYLGKPKVRAFIERELRGAKESERPARRESQGEPRLRAVAQPQLSSDLGRERAKFANDVERFDRDEALRAAIEEAKASGLG